MLVSGSFSPQPSGPTVAPTVSGKPNPPAHTHCRGKREATIHRLALQKHEGACMRARDARHLHHSDFLPFSREAKSSVSHCNSGCCESQRYGDILLFCVPIHGGAQIQHQEHEQPGSCQRDVPQSSDRIPHIQIHCERLLALQILEDQTKYHGL